MRQNFKYFSVMALHICLFHTRCLYEEVLLALAVAKSKYQSTLRITEDSLCSAVSNLHSRLNSLYISKQAYSIHQQLYFLSSLIYSKLYTYIKIVLYDLWSVKMYMCIYILYTCMPSVTSNSLSGSPKT